MRGLGFGLIDGTCLLFCEAEVLLMNQHMQSLKMPCGHFSSSRLAWLLTCTYRDHMNHQGMKGNRMNSTRALRVGQSCLSSNKEVSSVSY